MTNIRNHQPGSLAIMACHDCGAIHRLRPLQPGEGASCRQCERLLATAHHRTVERALALHWASAILFVLAHSLPFMTFELEGRALTAHIWEGSAALSFAGMWPLGILVLLLATIIPGTKIALGIWVLQFVHAQKTSPRTARLFRWLEMLRPWAMMEVYLLGVIVAFVKLSDLADLELEMGLWCFAALIPLLTLSDFILDPREVWDGIQRQNTNLREGSMVVCHPCGQLAPQNQRTCSRCYAPLHARKPNSLSATWALVIAAALLYVPANILPIMTVISFGQGEPDTIMSGVFKLVDAGMLPIAALVLFASVIVPVLKLSGLAFLLVSVQRGVDWNRRDRTKLYRVIEWIGRWSMVDIFMIAILTSLVNLGNIALIEPGAGALCFAAVVILTMIASHRFDPKLIWDNQTASNQDGRPLRV